VFFIVLIYLLVIFDSTAVLDLSSNSLTGMIPSQIALMSNLCELSVVWLLVVMIVLSCVFFIVLSCLLVIFIQKIGWKSTTIISRANSHVLPLLTLVTFPVMTTTMIHADPFKETLMHSRGVNLYKIVYIIGLKCTLFTLFYNEFDECHSCTTIPFG
jgi:hypothetical protein